MNTFISRKQYMAGEYSHDEYYAQFGFKLVNLVMEAIGKDAIVKSADPHFNDIPLAKWDRLQPSVISICGNSIAEANGSGGISLSDCVCAAKSAAKIIRDNARQSA